MLNYLQLKLSIKLKYKIINMNKNEDLKLNICNKTNFNDDDAIEIVVLEFRDLEDIIKREFNKIKKEIHIKIDNLKV